MSKQLLRAFICCTLVLSAHGQCLGETKRVTCAVKDVASIGNDRVHVRCSNIPDGFQFFAAPLDGSGIATRLTDAGTAAMQTAGLKLLLDYCPNDLSGANIGCINANCRLVRNVILEKE